MTRGVRPAQSHLNRPGSVSVTSTADSMRPARPEEMEVANERR